MLEMSTIRMMFLRAVLLVLGLPRISGYFAAHSSAKPTIFRTASSAIPRRSIDADREFQSRDRRNLNFVEPRRVALDVLRSATQNSRGVEGALANHPGLVFLEQRDRSFVKALVATTERHQGQLDTVLSQYMPQGYPPTGSHGLVVMVALRLGACQLLFLDTPPFAAVDATVNLLKDPNLNVPGQFGKLVNAVLRKVADDGPRALSRTSPTDNLSPVLHAAWEQQWGVKATAKMAAAMLFEPPLDITLRAPPLPPPRRVRRALLQAREGLGNKNAATGTTAATGTMPEEDAFLGGESEAGLSWRASWCRALGAEALPTGSLRIKPSSEVNTAPDDDQKGRSKSAGTGAVTSLPGFMEGAWWVQDAAAAVPALALVSALQQQASGNGGNGAFTVSSRNGAESVTRVEEAGGSNTAAAGVGDEESATDFSASSTVVELKDRCRSLGLGVGGRKQELIDRLTAHCSTTNTNTESSSKPNSVISSSSSSSSNSGSSSSSNSDHPAFLEEASTRMQNPLSHMRVADVCAAPGGKTAQLLSSGFGHVTAIEADPRRATMLQANLDRLRLGTPAHGHKSDFKLWVGDGCTYQVDDSGSSSSDTSSGAESESSVATTTRSPHGFDGILLDAPCSATGTGRRRPDVLRKRLPPPPSPFQLVSESTKSNRAGDGAPTRAAQRRASKARQKALSKEDKAAEAAASAEADDWYGLLRAQRKLAAHCAQELLEPGGVLVYSTCSLLREEGEDQAERLLRLTSPPACTGHHADEGDDEGSEQRPQPFLQTLPFQAWEVPGLEGAITPEGWLRILPGCLEGPFANADGFFVARFVKDATTTI